jgi:hypothetical protein
MVKNKTLTFLFLSLSFFGISQTVEKIKFKKDKTIIYFFQNGEKTDTLNALSENFFYLVVHDILKKDLSIQVENGQLMPTLSDSVVKFNYLPGFQYESFYVSQEIDGGEKKKKVKLEFTTLVNGTPVLKAPKISISLINKATGGLILEDVFFYKND